MGQGSERRATYAQRRGQEKRGTTRAYRRDLRSSPNGGARDFVAAMTESVEKAILPSGSRRSATRGEQASAHGEAARWGLVVSVLELEHGWAAR